MAGWRNGVLVVAIQGSDADELDRWLRDRGINPDGKRGTT